jgi:hypothetical protein
MAPQEDAYQTELLYVLKSWLGEGVIVVSQPIAVIEGDQKKGRPRHSDILIEFELERVVLELVAHTGFAGVREHVDRICRCARACGARRARCKGARGQPSLGAAFYDCRLWTRVALREARCVQVDDSNSRHGH